MLNRLLFTLFLSIYFLGLSAQNDEIINQEVFHYKEGKSWKKVRPKKADLKKTTIEYKSGLKVIEKLRLADNQLVHKQTYLNNKPIGNWISYSKSRGLIEYNVDSLPQCEVQKKSDKPQEEVDSILAQRNLPIYKESSNDFYKDIVTNVRYPYYAKDNGISGTVYMGFKVDTIGMVKDVCIRQGTHWSLDLEAFRVINLLDQFKVAGKEEGRAIETQMWVPVKFNLR